MNSGRPACEIVAKLLLLPPYAALRITLWTISHDPCKPDLREGGLHGIIHITDRCPSFSSPLLMTTQAKQGPWSRILPSTRTPSHYRQLARNYRHGRGEQVMFARRFA
ncbi:hypothetical protein IG631_17540 [Alternaria alternata]|nr:hypothetical protein IG631_17540 [Alternaria alternata]